ncbi:MAG: YigZ family protein [Gemmatimonadales bacterium]|nr:MAG: YigZ family protein [Gemmatimonadales bacterium]
MSDRYPVPKGRHRVSESIRRSRFVTTVGPAPDEEVARAFIEEVRDEFSDATHNCWAFVAGPPGSTARVGMSDDGEPHQTAGRPMLNALLHSGVGEVVAVVTRYYGGVKLGRGGLGRAYSGGVQLALASLPLVERVDRVPVRIRLGYDAVDAVLRLLEEHGVERVSDDWGRRVTLELAVPCDDLERVVREVRDCTAGTADVVVEPEGS